jgi:hypothetical protein
MMLGAGGHRIGSVLLDNNVCGCGEPATAIFMNVLIYKMHVFCNDLHPLSDSPVYLYPVKTEQGYALLLSRVPL